jgi:Tfp pilus assembly protein PilE
MKRHAHRTRGLTLIEMTLVVATIALLVGFGLPAVRSLIHSFESESGTRGMISAALSAARATAVKNQCYAGVRFQKRCTSKDQANPLEGVAEASQYMVFIMHEEPKNMGGLTVGFRAMLGREPVKLPEKVAVVDVGGIDDDEDIDEAVELNNITAFSVIFSPSGKLVVHDVRVRNRDGVFEPINYGTRGGADSGKNSFDDIFNSVENIIPDSATTKEDVGMLIQDDYPDWGLDREASRTRFVICDHLRLQSEFEKKTVWSEYLSLLPDEAEVFVSPYTGTLISSD